MRILLTGLRLCNSSIDWPCPTWLSLSFVGKVPRFLHPAHYRNSSTMLHSSWQTILRYRGALLFRRSLCIWALINVGGSKENSLSEPFMGLNSIRFWIVNSEPRNFQYNKKILEHMILYLYSTGTPAWRISEVPTRWKRLRLYFKVFQSSIPLHWVRATSVHHLA